MRVGTCLIPRAKAWAREMSLSGLMLETQDNNMGACRLNMSCGFKLKGFDTCLYAGIEGCRDEIALYWYYTFDGAVAANGWGSTAGNPDVAGS